jgi:hypothetical protein
MLMAREPTPRPGCVVQNVAIVDALPKTRSGKTLRATIRQIADGQEWTTPPTIEDAQVLDDFDATDAEAGLWTGARRPQLSALLNQATYPRRGPHRLSGPESR